MLSRVLATAAAGRVKVSTVHSSDPLHVQFHGMHACDPSSNISSQLINLPEQGPAFSSIPVLLNHDFHSAGIKNRVSLPIQWQSHQAAGRYCSVAQALCGNASRLHVAQLQQIMAATLRQSMEVRTNVEMFPPKLPLLKHLV